MTFYVEFGYTEELQYESISYVIQALGDAKRTQDFRDEKYWLGFFDERAQSKFWWPTQEEASEWLERWDSTPPNSRAHDPSLRKPWHFASMIDAFRDGEYELVGCRKLEEGIARIEYEPLAWPFGGTGCMCALVEAFGADVRDRTPA